MVEPRRAYLLLALCALFTALLHPGPALARSHGSGEDHVALFSNLDVDEDSPAGAIVCAFCNVRVRGDVHGDIAVLFSTLDIGDDRAVSGDVAALFSTVRLAEGTHVSGDLATAFGTVSAAPTARIDGNRTAFFSTGLGLSLAVAPLLILVGLIWLAVWVVRRIF